MAEPFYTASPSRRMQTRALIGLGLGTFLLGAVATWMLAGSPGMPSFDLFTVKDEKPAAPPVVAPTSAATTPLPAAEGAGQAAELEQMAEQQGGLDQRVAAMEQRLARLDLQSQAAAGNAARAEGLLVTFAARRSLERGVPLGYLADQLRLRFGDAQPNAVHTVIEVSRNPVTLDRLIARLDGLAPELAEAPPEEGLWSSMTRELGELFVVRREDSPSPQPARRLQRARLFLESGRADAAVSEVRNLPNAPAAAGWIADAERYAAAQQALELLETAALLEPRELRDAAGERVVQPSPVGGN